MDGRRPRIKPSVNLQPKRKVDSVKTQSPKSSAATAISPQNSPKKLLDEKLSSNKTGNNAENTLPILNLKTENTSDSVSSPFKRPPDLRNTSSTDSNVGTINQLILPAAPSVSTSKIQPQNTPTSNNSSLQTQLLKPRQRIRPTPYFGATRRSSIQGNSINDIEEDHPRRQRHLSEHSAQQSIGVEKLQSTVSASERNSSGADSSATEGGNNTTNSVNTQRNQSTYRHRKISSSDDITLKLSSSTTTKRTPMKYNNNSKPVEKSSMKMLDFIYYNPSTNPMNSQTDKSSEAETEETESEPKLSEKDESPKNKVQENVVAPAVPVPQLKLGPNGEVIIDEQSLVIETTAEKEGRKNLLTSEILYLDDNTGNNGFYKRQKRTKDWTSEETIRFYRCLRTVGTDFSLMLTLFPNRTRRDLKLKFNKEEKTNLQLVNKALKYPSAFNLDELRRELEAEEKIRREKKICNDRVVKIYKKNTNKQQNLKLSKASRTLAGGDTAHKLITTDIKKKPSIRFTKKRSVDSSSSPAKKQVETNLVEEIIKNIEGDDMDEQTIFETLVNDDDDVGDLDITKDLSDVKSGKQNDVSKQQQSLESHSLNNNNINQDDISKFLTELPLVLVSSEDSNNPGKIINEIHIMCKETKQLSDKALDLPEDVINYITSNALVNRL